MTLKTTPIPSRNWKITKDPVSERDLKRKESKQRVDRRIYYLWFHFLKLCLELESVGHIFEKRVGGGKVILGEGKLVKVNRDEYVGWDLDEDGSKTINGAIIDHLDQIPQENVCLELGLYRIEILQIEENFIVKVKINKKGS